MSSGNSKLTLYDLGMEGLQIQDTLFAQEGELDPETEQRLDTILREGPERIEAAAMVVQNLEASALACEQEALRLNGRAQSFHNNAKRLKQLMAFALDAAFGGKVKTFKFTCYTQKAPDTVAFDLKEDTPLEFVPLEYVRVKKELDKTALKAAYERGDTLPDAIFVEQRIGQRYTRIR